MKKESTKKCSSLYNHELLNIIKYFLIFIFIQIKTIFASEECKTDLNLKIGIIDSEFINYQYYLYYELGNFSQEENIEFDIGYVENNIDEFDIIFGEWDKLSKLSLKKIFLPSEVKEFYENNEIEIKENILPLDLDTFIILSNQNYTIKNLEELSNLNNPVKYTFGMSFDKNDDLLKLISYTNHKDFIELDSHSTESVLNSLKKLYIKSNKNILSANFSEMYESYENKENLFTLFNDGILLYKNLKNNYFNLFPQSQHIWDEDQGVFKNHSNFIPYSFFGFSAYVNNTNQIGLLCHFIKKSARERAFRDFNLQISPLSIHEVQNILDILPAGYSKILESKNKNIIKFEDNKNNREYTQILEIIFDNIDYKDTLQKNSHLNY